MKFNIQNYINIDSATLVAYDLKTRDGYYGNNVPGTIKLELYDCKNSQIIKGSEIISGEITEGSSVSSNNFIENLPNEDIELGVKLTKSSNFYASTSDIILILKRK
ncbi:hypothetical protein J0383_07990 [Flavobacterium endoglycinae]|uniref:Uncharacterized protein n=1 Tax=Flavobacterium endoglycinae TaxID=2816357 RepID=A0ABX7QI08_9FLAO|nr:hypothetical protein [Flavobacterium endoglycinae]QSW90740.1 hypothetical protein J0383_07990 [Flavobacterium endoglycinae]